MGELRRLTADDLPAIRAAVVAYRNGLAEHLESGEQFGNFTGAEALEDVLGEPRTDPDVPGVAGYKYVPVNLYQAELSRELVDALKDLWCRLRLYDTKTQKYELFAAIDDVIRKIDDAGSEGGDPSPSTKPGFVWFSATEAADYVGVTDKTMRGWIRDHQIAIHGENKTRYSFEQTELDSKKEATEKRKSRSESNE